MVPSRHAANCSPVAPLEHPDQRQYGTSIVETDGILLARQSQAAGIGEQEPAAAARPQPAVSLYRSPAKTIHGARPTPSSAWMPKRRSGWESSRILESAGNRSRSRSRTTISPATRWAGPFLMVFTIPARIADLWRWAPATKLRPLPSMPLLYGGTVADRKRIRRPRNC